MPAKRSGPGTEAPQATHATATSAKRARKNIVVDVDALGRAMAALRSTNQSETVNVALARLAEDAAVLAGIDAAIGMVPDFPDLDT